MAFTPNQYRKKAYEDQLAAIEEANKQYQLQADLDLKKAKETQLTANRSAASNYYNFINPYGIQADAMAKSGLKNSGLNQTSKVNAYSSFQNRLGAAAKTYAGTQADIDAELRGVQYQANADKMTARANYYNTLGDEYDGYVSSNKSSGSKSSNSSSDDNGGGVELMDINQAYSRYKSAKTQEEKDYYWNLYISMKSFLGAYRSQY
jgi:hypothetical protein